MCTRRSQFISLKSKVNKTNHYFRPGKEQFHNNMYSERFLSCNENDLRHLILLGSNHDFSNCQYVYIQYVLSYTIMFYNILSEGNHEFSNCHYVCLAYVILIKAQLGNQSIITKVHQSESYIHCPIGTLICRKWYSRNELTKGILILSGKFLLTMLKTVANYLVNRFRTD